MSSYLDYNGLGIYHENNKNYIDGKIPTKTSELTNDSNFVTTDTLNTSLNAKAPLASPTLTGTPKAPTASVGTNTTQIATTAFVQSAVSNLVNGAPETMNTLKELSDAIEEHQDITDALNSAITNKVDKVSGKGLSTNDYTTTEKTKLSGIATGAEVNQNTFSNVKVGTTTISADSKTDTLELVAGDNITITTDTTNDKITISSTGGGESYTHPDSGATVGTYRSVTVDAQGHVTDGSNPTLTVAQGGTGATDAKTARTNLGITPANVGALKHTTTSMVGLGFTAKSTVTVEDFLIALRTKIGVNSAQVDISWSSANGATVSDGTNSVLIEGGVLYTSGSGNIVSGTWATYTAIYFHQSSSTFYKFATTVSSTAGTYSTSMKKYLPADLITPANIGALSTTGTAANASRLSNTSAIGSVTNPVYFNADGVPVKTTYTLGASVPSDAVFTDTTYSVATTSANGLMSSTDKSKLNATNIAYGTCSTDSATAAKVITISGNTNWKLSAGSMITIKFSATNTAQNPTFNVNSTGAKSVWYNTAVITTSSLGYAGTANRPMNFVYDGTQYVFVGWSLDNNTTYSNASLGQGYGTCATAAATVAKVVTLSSYSLTTGGIVSIKFTNAVPASATMNINGKGAKAIYYRGSAIKAGIINAGDMATFIYNGSQYHLIAIDSEMSSGGGTTIYKQTSEPTVSDTAVWIPI